MTISIVHGPSHQGLWVPLGDSAVIYEGGLVTVNTDTPTEGITMLPDAAGVANVTNLDIPLGVCVGTARRYPVWDSTYKTHKLTDPGATDALGGACIEYTGVEGPWCKGDQIAMAKIDMITPDSTLKSSLFYASTGTAPTLLTSTNTNGNGTGITTNATSFTPDGNSISTIYCRSGANAGAYRTLTSASTTVHTWDMAMKYDIAIGDTFVCVPMRTFGPSTVMFDATTAAFIDVDDNPVLAGTNRWSIIVIRLDLSVAGQEYVEFRFDIGHFGAYMVNA
jgi:hypothetical protein